MQIKELSDSLAALGQLAGRYQAEHPVISDRLQTRDRADPTTRSQNLSYAFRRLDRHPL